MRTCYAIRAERPKRAILIINEVVFSVIVVDFYRFSLARLLKNNGQTRKKKIKKKIQTNYCCAINYFRFARTWPISEQLLVHSGQCDPLVGPFELHATIV